MTSENIANDGLPHAVRPFLDIRNISLRFEGVQALDNVSFAVGERSRCGLIGPNGAGKTTLFNCISRLVDINSGAIAFTDHDLVALAPHQIHALGIARTFQGVALVPGMTVLDNVMAGAGRRGRHGFLRSGTTLAEYSSLDRNGRKDALEALDRVGLADVAQLTPSELPFGTQKRVELARALISRPRLLLLDEPANGLTETEVNDLRDLLLKIYAENDISLLIVEHHMGFVMGICDDIVVLDAGRLLARGTPSQIRSDPAVIEAYLGRRQKEKAS